MIRSKIFKTLLPLLLLAIVGYFSYRYFLKDFYWNNQTQTIHLNDISDKKQFELKKHAAQTGIYSIEFEINGNSDQNLLFLFGDSPSNLSHQILVKKGEIDFVNVMDWYQDKCYMEVLSESNAKINLEIDYRFIGNNQ